MQYLTGFDILLPVLYLFILFFYSGYITKKYEKKLTGYGYFQKAVFIKILGALAFGLIYVFYYGGGDTTNYFQSSEAYLNVASKDFGKFLDLVFFKHSDNSVGDFFDNETGFPIYRFSDSSATFTTCYYIPLTFLGGYSFMATTMLAAFMSFTGLWKLYRVFVNVFPMLTRQLFIAIFCVPSVFFWGSGIMKDSIIIGSIGWYVYGFYWFFIRKYRRPRFFVFVVIASWLMLSVKPYVFFALLPGSIIWLSNQYAMRFSSTAMRTIFTPVILVIGSVLAFFALRQLDSVLGVYKLETVAERALIVNKDLKMDYYGGKTFDIGEYEPTPAGMLSVAHKAIFAALFRPTLLDTQNIVMVLSALENLYLLVLTLILLVKLKVIGFFIFIWKQPLLLFSFLFAVFFAFSVGISISNFGSLVRLRIPALPFFVSSLFIIRYLYETGRRKQYRY